MAPVCIQAKLVNHFKGVFAPVLNIDQGIKQGRTVIPFKTVRLPQNFRSGKHIRRNDPIQQSGKLSIG